MLILRHRAYARAGLVGNPSDGYHGRTISISVRNFWAEVVLYEWEDVELVWTEQDETRFSSIHDLVRDVRLHGYYGGMRLVKATIKKFADFCLREQHPLHERNFSVRYDSNVPRQVGLAGSSAIIVATLRCLCEFYEVSIAREVQASLALSVEAEELGIAAGLQDRVIQVYEGLVSMDFAKESMTKKCGYDCGRYEPMDPELLPPLYVAYSTEEGEPTEVFHNDIRGRFNQGDTGVVQALARCALLASQAREAIQDRDAERLGKLMDENFDQRRSIYQLPRGQLQMVETARQVGASANFAGSGGAIVGTYRDAAMFHELEARLGDIGCRVVRPKVAKESR